jgi:transposase
MPLKASTVRQQAALHLEALPGLADTVIGDLLSELNRLDERIAQYDVHIRGLARGKDNPAQRLMRLSGIGETTATAILAMIGKGHEFKCGRQFAAWLGLVPGQYSSGRQDAPGTHHQGRRRLSAQPAGCWVRARCWRRRRISTWATALEQRRGYWKAVVAIAAKNARMAWAVLARGEAFKLPA